MIIQNLIIWLLSDIMFNSILSCFQVTPLAVKVLLSARLFIFRCPLDCLVFVVKADTGGVTITFSNYRLLALKSKQISQNNSYQKNV